MVTLHYTSLNQVRYELMWSKLKPLPSIHSKEETKRRKMDQTKGWGLLKQQLQLNLEGR